MKGKDVILGLLLKKPRTGYELKEYFETVFRHFFDGSFGMIYPSLRTLEKENKIKKKSIIQEGRPNKNEFHITESGKEDFFNYLSSSVNPEIRKSDFLMRLYFGEFISENNVKQFIENEIIEKEKLLHQLKTDYKLWENKLTVYQKLSFDIGVEQYQSELKVLRSFLEKYNSKVE